MKINDIVEIIYNKDGGNRTEVGKVGIIKHPFGNYNWLVDIYNFTTGKIEYGEELKEEQLRVLDNMPKETREYTANEIEEFRKIYEVKEDELRNFKEYDLVEIIRDRPEYVEEGFGIGDMGIIYSNVEYRGRIHMLVRDMQEEEDTELSVRREDVRIVDKWYKDHPKKYTDQEKESLLRWSEERAKFFKQKDEERRKKYGY